MENTSYISTVANKRTGLAVASMIIGIASRYWGLVPEKYIYAIIER